VINTFVLETFLDRIVKKLVLRPMSHHLQFNEKTQMVRIQLIVKVLPSIIYNKVAKIENAHYCILRFLLFSTLYTVWLIVSVNWIGP
jgi:hypothetical protein